MVVLDEPTRLDRSPRSPERRAIGPTRRRSPRSPADRRARPALEPGRRRLSAAGVGAGERAAISARTRWSSSSCLFGASKVGAVTVPVNWRLAAPRSSTSSTTRRVPVLVVGAEHVEVIATVADALASGSLVTLGAQDGRRCEDHGRRGRRTARRSSVAGADDVALQLYTSGTTGRPKGAMLTNRNVYMPPTAIGFDADSVNLIALPNFTSAACSSACSPALPRSCCPSSPSAPCSRRSPRIVTHVVLVPAVLPRCSMRRAPPAATSARCRRSSTAPPRSPRASSPERSATAVRLHPGLRTDRDGRCRDPPARGGSRPRWGTPPSTARGGAADGGRRGAHRRAGDRMRRRPATSARS